MEVICRFGQPGCGIEDLFAFVAFVGGAAGLLAAIVYARAYIKAADASEPVVTALKARDENAQQQINELKEQNTAQASEMATLRELVTQAARVETFRSESHQWRMDSQLEHSAQLDALRSIAKNQALAARTLIAIAKALNIPVRHNDHEDETT